MSRADELVERLERLAQKYEANHMPTHARGVWHALREVRAVFADELAGENTQ